MTTNPKPENRAATSQPRQVLHLYSYSDVETECALILVWFATNFVLTAEEIDSQGTTVETKDGRVKSMRIYFLRRKLEPGEPLMLQLKVLIARVPGFEGTDIDSMTAHEQLILYLFLCKSA